MSWLFSSGGQSIGASASVLPMNIQDSFPLGWTGLISLLSKGVSRIFSRITVKLDDKEVHYSSNIYFLYVRAKSIQSCLTLCDSMNCSLPHSSVHGILQARILEWVAIPFSREIFLTQGSNLGLLHCRGILYHLGHQESLFFTPDPV